MTQFAVIHNSTKPFLLGRYSTLEQAKKAVDGKPDIWLIYELKENS